MVAKICTISNNPGCLSNSTIDTTLVPYCYSFSHEAVTSQAHNGYKPAVKHKISDMVEVDTLVSLESFVPLV
jgi:hypothetical protein